jgi:Domain of unknown function (DUF4440)
MANHSTAILSGLLLATSILVGAPSAEIQGKWAAPDDPLAKTLIDLERRWAEGACTGEKIVEKILAEDFEGTSPTDGKIYSKQDALGDPKKHAAVVSARDCQLHSAQVRFFGDSIAIIYGSESAVRKDKSGQEARHSLVWTDTWLKRNGKWQIIAVQDMNMERK